MQAIQGKNKMSLESRKSCVHGNSKVASKEDPGEYNTDCQLSPKFKLFKGGQHKGKTLLLPEECYSLL
jgi:hypothetical protein